MSSFFDISYGQLRLQGPVQLEGAVDIQALPPGADGSIAIEILSMSLTGQSPIGPVQVRLSSRMKSRGLARNPRPVVVLPGREPLCVVDSFFDVFVDIELIEQKVVLSNFHPQQPSIPFRMVSRAPVPLRHDLVPFALFQENQQVVLFDQEGQRAGIVNDTVHEVNPPREEPPCYPPAGVDVMHSNLFHDIDVPGIGLCRANLSGPVTVRRSDPYVDPATGLTCIDTEIIELNLIGTDPVCGKICIVLNPFRPSLGRICEKVPGTCFPANSFFDVFIKVELKDLGLCLYSCVPAHMECMIDAIPPIGCAYNLNLGRTGQPVPLYRGPCTAAPGPAGVDPCAVQPLPPPAAYIVKAVHQPLPPERCKCFPPAGEDVINTTLFHQIVFPGFNIQCSSFTGPIVIRRGDPFLDANGLCCIKTEIVRLEMKGTCSNGTTAVIRLCPDRPSTGLICQKTATAGCFPAQSCFDIFFEVEVQMPGSAPMKFKNCRPARMCCMIDAIPPIGCPYGLENGPIELYKVDPAAPVSPCTLSPLPPPDAILQEARHIPEEPSEPCCPEFGPGKDVMDSTLLHDIDIPGVGVCHANLAGPVVVERGTPYRDPLTGLCCVEARMVSMQLQGIDPLCGRIVITLDPRRPSKGRICQMPGMTTCFPAESFFDVFVRVELPDLGRTFVACDPARMFCKVDRLPPFGCLYNLNIGAGQVVPLYRELAAADICALTPRPNPEAFIIKAVHRPEPPCACFPPAGEDTMQSELSHRVRLFGLGPNNTDIICDADMTGPMVVRGSGPRRDPASGLCCIDTLVTSMELRGIDPSCGEVILRLCPDRRSTGQICQKPENPPDKCFPANSFFDIFVEIEIPRLGLKLKNCSPARMECMIDAIPPINCVYQLNLSDVPLYKPDECARLPSPNIRPTGVIEIAQHVPRRPCDECQYGPGVDIMDSTLSHDIVLFGMDKVCGAPLTGVVEIEKGIPYRNAEGLCCVSTRMRKLELKGVDPACGPVTIRLCPDRPSRGIICQMMPGACFPAQSCFEVFIEVEVMGMVLKNCKPALMCCKISSLPPFGCTYQIDLGAEPVLLFKKGDCDNPNATPLGTIRQAIHTPNPCGPEPGSLKCEVTNGTVTLTWKTVCPCQQVRIIRDGAVIATVPGTVTSFTETPPCPPGTVQTYTYCIECVEGDRTSRRECCDVRVPCPDIPDCIQDVRCERQADGSIKISWTYLADCKCDRVLITFPDGNTLTVPGTETSVVLPCRSGQYCVQCLRLDTAGNPVLGPRHCCTVDCPPPECKDCIRDVRCTALPGRRVAVRWTLVDPECVCEKFEIWYAPGVSTPPVLIGTVAGNVNEFITDCRPGEYCVRCVCPDGTFGEFHCCTVRRCSPKFRRGDATGEGSLNITDPILVLGVLFQGRGELLCMDAADANDAGQVNITSAVYNLNFQFGGGPPPPAPGPRECGEDETEDELPECVYPQCDDV